MIIVDNEYTSPPYVTHFTLHKNIIYKPYYPLYEYTALQLN